MVKLKNNKTHKEWDIKPIERNGKKYSSKDEAIRIMSQYPGVFTLIDNVKNKTSKEIIAEADSKENKE